VAAKSSAVRNGCAAMQVVKKANQNQAAADGINCSWAFIVGFVGIHCIKAADKRTNNEQTIEQTTNKQLNKQRI
jgi:glycerol uptake facilitator-like aquaporin